MYYFRLRCKMRNKDFYYMYIDILFIMKIFNSTYENNGICIFSRPLFKA